ncbi:FG-GAP-like repeat-containing protein [Streptomyces graminofaciens]|uniref:FG-GAP-like repeat-containing protein n=1 Tax=Streptomyces graminofaciens TaxID=68212 RepID=UPI0025734634|nr:FG-GAP-like repeat-containing protein [Streptomyces graminofaciens]
MRIRTAAALAALLVAGLTPLTLTTPASAAPAKHADDFNGDGYRDVAIGASNTMVDGKITAGAVVVLYGSSSGLSAGKRSVITQNSPGVPGVAEELDQFGASLASGDLDRDGYADLVVSAPNEGLGDYHGVGTATILWGGKSGLSGGARVPQPDWVSEGGGYAIGLAAADFDGDGDTDLTVTSRPTTRVFDGPWKRTGAPAREYDIDELGSTQTVFAGDLSGDGAAERLYPVGVTGDEGGAIGYLRWTGTAYETTDLPTADGDQGAIGDVNGDGYGDLVLGNIYKGAHKGGEINVWYGGPTGPDPTQTPVTIHQDTGGVPGKGEGDDCFGCAVSVGDINGDGYADVAVGAQNEDVGGKRNTGSVTVLYGSVAGLTTAGATSYTQATAGVPGTAESQDWFGTAVRLVDLDKNGKADLVATAEGENDAKGAVWVLRGTAKGLTTKGAKSISAGAFGLRGEVNFGWPIAQ